MPVKEFVTIATAFVFGMAALHPRDYKQRLWKIQYAILKEARDTRSWGKPLIFQYQSPGKSVKRAATSHAR